MIEPGALLEPASLKGMGIRQQPFVAPEEDALFSDESLDLQVRMLRHNLQYSNMLQVMYGAPGAGKTCLAIRLISVVNQELELFLVRGERGLTSARIIADLLRALDRDTTSGSEHDAIAFARELSTDSEVDAPAALVIDDAHHLERQELGRLLNTVVRIDDASAHGFRLLLIAEPSLQTKIDTLESPLLVPGRVYAANIKPLSVEQTGAYLAYRLSQVGASWPFSDDEVAAIAEAATGLPGDIDEAAAKTLNHRFAVEVVDETPPARMPGERKKPGLIRTAAVGLIVIGAIAWTLWPRDEVPSPPANKPLALPQAPPPPDPEPLFKDESPSAPPEPQAVAPTETPLPAATPLPAPAPAPVPKAARVPEPEPAPVPKAAPAAQPAPVTDGTAAIRDARWLGQQAPKHYVVQLMAASDIDVLHEFIGANRLGVNAALFVTRRNGQPWHVLVYGLYRDAPAARNAIGRLPQALRRHSPWIRSIASVHEALRQAP